MCYAMNDEPEIFDARSLTASEQARKTFEIFSRLDPSDAFILLNNRDPRPLRHEFEAKYPRQFSWTYLEDGGGKWEVQIGKVALVT